MILLIGGTSETAPLALGMARAGYEVLVSQATDTPLAIPRHPRIRRRQGRLDAAGMACLAETQGIAAIVDASHPYAVAAHETVQETARRLGIPCLCFRRPESAALGDSPGTTETAPLFAADHGEAAGIAFGLGRPVLVTTGSRNLAPYAAASRRTGIPLFVRVLDTAESLAACAAAGIPAERIITGRGPFSVAANLAALRDSHCGVLVTKESGEAGGFSAKVEAARLSQCRLVVLRRPAALRHIPAYDRPEALLAGLRALIPPDYPEPAWPPLP